MQNLSWEVIHKIMGLAAIDEQFAAELLHEPVAAVQRRGFVLTPEETAAFEKSGADDIYQFSKNLLAQLHGQEN